MTPFWECNPKKPHSPLALWCGLSVWSFDTSFMLFATFTFTSPRRSKVRVQSPRSLKLDQLCKGLQTQRLEPASLCSVSITFRAYENDLATINYPNVNLWNVSRTIRALAYFLLVTRMHLKAFYLWGIQKCLYCSCLINLFGHWL